MRIVGYYVTCDDALCLDHAPTPDAWRAAGGFEGWEEPLPIQQDEAVDSPIHCKECEFLLPVDLTEAGVAYTWEQIVEHVTSNGVQGRDVILAKWWLAYRDDIVEELLPDNDDAHQVVDVAVTYLDAAAYQAPDWDLHTPLAGVPLTHRRQWRGLRINMGLDVPDGID